MENPLPILFHGKQFAQLLIRRRAHLCREGSNRECRLCLGQMPQGTVCQRIQVIRFAIIRVHRQRLLRERERFRIPSFPIIQGGQAHQRRRETRLLFQRSLQATLRLVEHLLVHPLFSLSVEAERRIPIEILRQSSRTFQLIIFRIIAINQLVVAYDYFQLPFWNGRRREVNRLQYFRGERQRLDQLPVVV